MDWDHLLRNTGFDRYDRNARLYPALVSLLPLFVVIAVWSPQVWTRLGGLASVIAACGLTFGVMQIVRHLGRRVEARLGVRAGRARSAALLTHADTSITRDTKARYHGYLRSHGILLADEDAERLDPIRAYEACRSAVDWLLEHTRPAAKDSLLHGENVAYGFRRNLFGLKPFALSLAVIALAANSWFLCSARAQDRFLAGLVVELFVLLTLFVWLGIVRTVFVEDAANAYGHRFLAHCEMQAPAAARKARRTIKPASGVPGRPGGGSA